VALVDLARLSRSLHNRLQSARALARGGLLRLAYGPAVAAGSGLAVGRDVELDLYGALTIGRNVKLSSGCRLYVGPGATLEIGDEVFIGRNTVIAANASVRIGPYTSVAEHCTIRDSDHDLTAAGRRRGHADVAPVTIGQDVWIGAGARILRGTTLGAEVVVGANAVVRGSFPDRVVLAGVPARVIKRLDDEGSGANPSADQNISPILT
jgi:acetyltransferase-like isoleucine patch superfamily enzyme